MERLQAMATQRKHTLLVDLAVSHTTFSAPVNDHGERHACPSTRSAMQTINEAPHLLLTVDGLGLLNAQLPTRTTQQSPANDTEKSSEAHAAPGETFTLQITGLSAACVDPIDPVCAPSVKTTSLAGAAALLDEISRLESGEEPSAHVGSTRMIFSGWDITQVCVQYRSFLCLFPWSFLAPNMAKSFRNLL